MWFFQEGNLAREPEYWTSSLHQYSRDVQAQNMEEELQGSRIGSVSQNLGAVNPKSSLVG